MKLSYLPTVSALALVLSLGAPAMAQETGAQTADEPNTGTTQPADEAGLGENIGLSVAELHGLMTGIGVEDAEVFGGDAVVARTQNGHPTIMLVGPQDFEPGEVATLGVGTFRDLREQMTEAGFQEVTEARGWQPVQGTLDGHSVIAADPVWTIDADDLVAGVDALPTGIDGDMAEFGIGGPTGDFDRDWFEQAISQAGIENRSEFDGRFFHARTDAGESFHLLIGPESFAADQEVELGEDELRERLEGGGLSDVQMIEEDIAVYRGSYENMSVLILGGGGIAAQQTPLQSDSTGTDQED